MVYNEWETHSIEIEKTFNIEKKSYSYYGIRLFEEDISIIYNILFPWICTSEDPLNRKSSNKKKSK